MAPEPLNIQSKIHRESCRDKPPLQGTRKNCSASSRQLSELVLLNTERYSTPILGPELPTWQAGLHSRARAQPLSSPTRAAPTPPLKAPFNNAPLSYLAAALPLGQIASFSLSQLHPNHFSQDKDEGTLSSMEKMGLLFQALTKKKESKLSVFLTLQSP